MTVVEGRLHTDYAALANRDTGYFRRPRPVMVICDPRILSASANVISWLREYQPGPAGSYADHLTETSRCFPPSAYTYLSQKAGPLTEYVGPPINVIGGL